MSQNVVIYVIFMIVFIAAGIFTIKLLPKSKNTKEKKYRDLVAKILTEEGMSKFGVHNHGTSLDDIGEIIVISPKAMGVSENKNDTR